LDGGKEDAPEGDGEELWVGYLGCGVPAEGIGPGDFHLFNFHASGFGEPEPDIVPVMLELELTIGKVANNFITYSKLDSWLLSGYEGEDMVLCSGIYTFQNGEI